MSDFLHIFVPGMMIFVAIVCLVIGLDALVKWTTRDSRAALEFCVDAGYADVILYDRINQRFCIGVIDGEWRIKPVGERN